MMKFYLVISRAHPEDPGIAGDVEHEEDDCQGDQDHGGQKVVVKVAENLASKIISLKLLSFILDSETMVTIIKNVAYNRVDGHLNLKRSEESGVRGERSIVARQS